MYQLDANNFTMIFSHKWPLKKYMFRTFTCPSSGGHLWEKIIVKFLHQVCTSSLLKLRVFERKILRRIYGPTKESDGTWRIKSNEELNRLIGNKNIINYIKAHKLTWFGHVHRMPYNSMVKKVHKWSPALTRSLGRPKNRWEDDVKSDITNMKITNWRDCIRNRLKWKEFVEKAKTSLKL